MKATISDRIYLTGLTGAEVKSIKKALTFRNPKKDAAEQFGRASWDIPATLELFEETDDGLIIPRGVGHCADQVQDERHSHPVKITTNIKTRPYQERAIRLALTTGGGVIVAPTGAGKTTMGIEIAARLGQRCLVLVKSLDLAKQWQGAIKQFTGLDCGLIGSGKWQEGEQFTVALVQTLVKHIESLDYGLVICDECHNIPAVQAYSIINRQAAKYRFGLSATPQRRDNLEMMIHAALGPVAAEIEEREVEGSVLPVMVSLLRYNFQGNPESWVEFINQLAADEDRNRLLIASAIKSSRIVGTAVLTGTVIHAERLHSLAKDYGVNALLLHGQLSKKVREQRMKDAPNSPLIIGTLSLLSEGINWPHVGAIIFGSPVSASVDRSDPTATRLIQTVGRGRRPYPGKVRVHVLDIIDNHPFGKAAYRKRAEIYQLQGWHVR
jgi:superfamily II DNA or RNA helicase